MDLLGIHKIFRALNEADVRYLIVGGLAVVAHGYLRFTADIDLFIDLEKFNLQNALRALSNLGYRPRAPVDLNDFADEKIRSRWILEKNLKVFSLWSPDFPASEIDLFVESPCDFNASTNRRREFDAGSDLILPVIGLDDLIQMKLAAGRPKDLNDVQKLQELQDANNEVF